MKFEMIDRVQELSRGRRIVAVKAVTLSEEYLGDHFPTFPVLPGVLMLQALVEAAVWLVRDAQNFSPGVILLRQAKNVTYKSFVKPGSLLRVDVRCRSLALDGSDFEGVGYCREEEVVKARFSLTHCRTGQDSRVSPPMAARVIAQARQRWAHLYPPGTGSGEPEGT